MPSFNTNVPHHLNGVSQLPKSLRRDSNAREQINAYPDLSQGLIKRPPTDVISSVGPMIGDYDASYNLMQSNGYDSISHVINEDGVERYILILTRQYDYDGSASYTRYDPAIYDTVEKKWATIWHDTTNTGWFKYGRTTKSSDFSLVTIGDVTFLANRATKVLTSSEKTADTTSTGLLSVQEIHAESNYYTVIDGTRIEAKIASTDEDAANDLAAAICTGINTNFASNAHADTMTYSAIKTANGSGAPYTWNVTGKPTSGSNNRNTPWTQVGDIVTFTGIGGDLFLKVDSGIDYMAVSATKTIKIKKGTRLKIASTTCTAGSATGSVTFETIDGKAILMGSIRSATNTSLWTLECETRTYATALEKFSATQQGHQLLITHADGGDFSLTAGTESKGDSPFIAIKDEVQAITDLPIIAPDGFKVRVFGSVSTGQDDYYLKFKTTDNESWGKGHWYESLGPNEEFKIDTSTLPFLLIKQTDGTFMLKEADGKITNQQTPITSGLSAHNLVNPISGSITRVLKTVITGAIHDPLSNLLAAATGVTADDNAYLAQNSITIRGLEPYTHIGSWSTLGMVDAGGSSRSYLVHQDTDADEHGVVTLILGVDGTSATATALLAETTLGYYYADGGVATIFPVEDYNKLKWNGRLAGDSLTCPMPQFVGSYISDLCVHEGRLGIVSPKGIDFSETGEFFNFFRTTVTDLLDSDPIPITAAGASNVYITKAEPLKESVLLFSNNDQFSVSAAGGAFTPSNVGVYQSSRFSVDTRCKPVAMHDSIYAISSGPTTSGLIEFMSSDNVAKSYKGVDVAENAPTYLPFEIKQLTALPHENLVAMLPKVPDVTSEATDKYTSQQDIYFFKYSDAGGKRQQSALFKFTLSLSDFKDDNNLHSADGSDFTPVPQIRSIQAVGNKLFILTAMLHYTSSMSYPRSAANFGTSQITSILEMDFSALEDSVYNSTLTHLDNRCSYDGANEDSDEETTVSKGFAFKSAYSTNTTFKLPFRWDGTTTTPVVVTKSTASGAGGTAVTIIGTPNGVTGEIVLSGNQQDANLYFGLPYTMEYQYHDPILKTQSQEGGPSFLQGGRHQVNRASIEFEDTGDFSVEVDTLGRNGETGDGVFTYPFVADATSLDATTEGGMTTQTGIFSVPIRSKSGKYTMKITSSSHKPVKILSTEYENTFNSSRGLR